MCAGCELLAVALQYSVTDGEFAGAEPVAKALALLLVGVYAVAAEGRDLLWREELP